MYRKYWTKKLHTRAHINVDTVVILHLNEGNDKNESSRHVMSNGNNPRSLTWKSNGS